MQQLEVTTLQREQNSRSVLHNGRIRPGSRMASGQLTIRPVIPDHVLDACFRIKLLVQKTLRCGTSRVASPAKEIFLTVREWR